MSMHNQTAAKSIVHSDKLTVNTPVLVHSHRDGLSLDNGESRLTLRNNQLALLTSTGEYSVGHAFYSAHRLNVPAETAQTVSANHVFNIADAARAAILTGLEIPLYTMDRHVISLASLRHSTPQCASSKTLFTAHDFSIKSSLADSRYKKDSYNTLIIGAGPYGTSAALSCAASRIDACWVGDPLSFWIRNIQPTPLRSARSATNLYTFEPGHTFLDFCNKYGLPQEGKIQFWEFLAYYFDLIDTFGVFPDMEVVKNISYTGDRWRALVTGPNGIRVIHARNIINATGIGMHPNTPPIIRTLPGNMSGHVSEYAVSDLPKGKEIAVIGGGQSAIEFALEAARENNVTLFAKDPLVFRNLHDPSRFIYRYLAANCEKYIWLLPTQLRNLLLGYLLHGTCEPETEAQIRERGLNIKENCQITKCYPDGDNRVVVEYGNTAIRADLVIAATGYRYDMRNIDYLKELLDNHKHVTAGFFPRLNSHAMLMNSPAGMYFAGYSCMHAIGFKSQFIGGTNIVIKRIINDILERR